MNGYGHKWTEDKLRDELLKCIDLLMLDRMPTAEELKSIGRNDVHVKVSRTKKYSGWAKELGLQLKSCETRVGQEWEGQLASFIALIGPHRVERMSTKYPYDLLIDGCVKVDVKTAKPHYKFGYRVQTFGINKTEPTCDIYILVALDENGKMEKMYVIPSHLMKMKTFHLRSESTWDAYIGRWDFIRKYSDFYHRVV